MRETGTLDRRLLVACQPDVLRSGATCLMSAALFAASGKPPCGHPHPGEDGSEPQPTTTGRCYLGVIITGTIYVHTHGSQQRSAARFDNFHLVRAGGCLEPGRVGEAVVHPHPPSSILHPVRTDQPVVTHAVFERNRVRLRDVCFSTGFHCPDRQTSDLAGVSMVFPCATRNPAATHRAGLARSGNAACIPDTLPRTDCGISHDHGADCKRGGPAGVVQRWSVRNLQMRDDGACHSQGQSPFPRMGWQPKSPIPPVSSLGLAPSLCSPCRTWQIGGGQASSKRSG